LGRAEASLERGGEGDEGSTASATKRKKKGLNNFRELPAEPLGIANPGGDQKKERGKKKGVLKTWTAKWWRGGKKNLHTLAAKRKKTEGCILTEGYGEQTQGGVLLPRLAIRVGHGGESKK